MAKSNWVRDTNEEYHAKPDTYGSSTLSKILISPQHALLKVEASQAMRMGTLLHASVLEGLEVTEDHVREVYKTKDAIANALTNLNGMKWALDNHAIARDLLSSGASEESGYVEYQGLNVRIRPDKRNYLRKTLVDLKTATDASVEIFPKKVFDNREYGYCLQGSFYLDIANIIEPGAFDDFAWIVVENKPPFGVNVFLASKATIEIGRGRYERAIGILQKCIKDNYWPGYEVKAHTIEVPAWCKE